MRTLALVVVALLLGLACAAAPASAERGRLADFSLRLTSRTPASPTGVAVHLLLHRAGDRSAKPSPLRSAVLVLPRGLRFDSGAVPQCTASDDELRLLGSDACPADTELTVGSFTAMTGFGPPIDPLTNDLHIFNGPRQIIEVITVPNGPVSPAFDRLTYDGSRFTAHPPTAPGGPPEGQSSVRSIDYRIPVRMTRGRAVFTTPPGCPSGGAWITRATFGFADGTRDTVASATPCAGSP